MDEQKVKAIKFERRYEDLTKNAAILQQKVDQLTLSEATYKEENSQLQKRLKEFIDANKEVTSNYQIVKRNYDIKKHEIDDLTLEIEEAKNACQSLLKQKKAMQLELTAANKVKTDLLDKQKTLEATLARKERDIADLLNKLNETISDYELKLERKDEQIWQMTFQMNEEAQKHQASQKTQDKNANYGMDPNMLSDLEKKFQAKEKMLFDEHEKLTQEVKVKDEKINALQEQVTELGKRQFQPRMERLKVIEADIKNRMLEYSLAEERMETGFLCPKDLKFFKTPVTLSPCGVILFDIAYFL